MVFAPPARRRPWIAPRPVNVRDMQITSAPLPTMMLAASRPFAASL